MSTLHSIATERKNTGNVCPDSEFAQKNYDVLEATSAFGDYLKREYTAEYNEEDEFSFFMDRLISRMVKSPVRDDLLLIRKGSQSIPEIGSLDFVSLQGEVKDIDTSLYIKKLQARINELCDGLFNDSPDDLTISKNAFRLVNNYLDAYFDVAKDVVFSPYNYNLSTSSFRRSAFLRSMISFSAERALSHKEVGKRQYRFSLFDPFLLDVIVRGFKAAGLLREFWSKNNQREEYLRELQKALFLDSIQSGLRRFVTIDNETYRLQPDRHDSKFWAIPYDQVSSLQEIKMIRLFEKTAAYIRNEAFRKEISTEQPSFDISICIIGHSAPSDNKSEAGLLDYIRSVLKWYSRLFRGQIQSKKPTLNIRLKNIVSQDDSPKSNFAGKRTEKTVKEVDGEHVHSCKFEIEHANYYENFGYSSKRLLEIISENEIVFILDCPWLMSENYSIETTGSLESYSRLLNFKRRSSPDFTQDFIYHTHSFYQNSTMKELDAQFNRVMTSDTFDSGTIARVPKEPLLSRIEKAVSTAQNNKCNKVVYLFTSEKNGLEYSSISTYPLTRTERYDGKVFTIVRYGSGSINSLMLCDEGQPLTIRVHLWSLIKYISASFAYQYFKEEIQKCLGVSADSVIDYVGIYRSITIELSLEKNLRQGTGKVWLLDTLDNCLEEIDDLSEKSKIEISELKKALLKLANDLVEPIFNQILFSPISAYGDNAIQMAFIMNLYSSVDNVEKMLFWHQYRRAHHQGRCGDYAIQFSKNKLEDKDITPLVIRDDEFKNKDFFMDKKIYDCFLWRLEDSAEVTPGMMLMIKKAEGIYHIENVGYIVLDNIIKACERSSQTNIPLYNNARKMIKVFSHG